MSTPRVAVIGDYMQDHWLLATTSGLSAEAPIPVFKVDSTLVTPGGAGNISANLKALGAVVVEFYGGQGPSWMDQSIQKHRLMVGDTQVARWDTHDYCAAIRPSLLDSLASMDAIVVGDYNKGSISSEVLEAIIAADRPLFVSTKPNGLVPPGAYRPPAVLFANAQEISQDCEFLEHAQAGGKLIATLGASGMMEIGCKRISAPAVHVRCVCGAGDTVVAAYTYASLLGLDDPLKFAALAAAVVVSKPFTATASLAEIKTFEENQPNETIDMYLAG